MDPFAFSMQRIADLVWVAFDTEATGYSNVTDRLVEVAGVRFRWSDRGWQEEGVFSELVNPDCPIPEVVTGIHGLRDEDVAGACSSTSVLERFFSFAEDAVLLAHYAPFDVGVITFAFAREGRPVPSNYVLDTFTLAKSVFPELSNYSLENLARHLRIPSDEHHRALPDARTTKALFERCVAKIGKADALLVGHLLEHSGPPVDFSSFAELPRELPEELRIIETAIAEHRDLEIEYQGGSRGKAPRRVTPSHLFAREGHVFLEGRCHLDGTEKSFRLDRITAIRIPDPKESAPETTS